MRPPAVVARRLRKAYYGRVAVDAAQIAINVAWLVVVTAALFTVPVRAVRNRLVA